MIQWFLDWYGQKLLWPFSSWYLKFCIFNELMNWADFMNVDSDAIIFGLTDIELFENARGPLQLYFFFTLIIFALTLACFIIQFMIWIIFCVIEFAIIWNMFYHCFGFIFVCYHIKCFKIFMSFVLFETYFWG